MAGNWGAGHFRSLAAIRRSRSLGRNYRLHYTLRQIRRLDYRLGLLLLRQAGGAAAGAPGAEGEASQSGAAARRLIYCGSVRPIGARSAGLFDVVQKTPRPTYRRNIGNRYNAILCPSASPAINRQRETRDSNC